MKWRTEVDNTKQEVFSREIDIHKKRFSISQGELIRISLGLLVFAFPAWVGFYFEQYVEMGIGIAWGCFAFLWQLLYYGYNSKSKNKSELSVTNFYSKGTLIFLAIFWTVLIAGVSIALYLKLPGS